MEVHFKNYRSQLQLKKSNIITSVDNEAVFIFNPQIVSRKELIYYICGRYFKINDDFKVGKIEVVEKCNYTLMYLPGLALACYYNLDGYVYIFKLEKMDGLYCYNFVKFLKIGYDLGESDIITTENYIVYKRSYDVYKWYDPISDTYFPLSIKDCRLHSLQNNIIGCEYHDEIIFLSLPDLKHLGSIKLLTRGFKILSMTRTTFQIWYYSMRIHYYSFSDNGIIPVNPIDYIIEFEYPWNYNEQLLKYIPILSVVDLILVPYL